VIKNISIIIGGGLGEGDMSEAGFEVIFFVLA
jgi:hypothetical protein